MIEIILGIIVLILAIIGIAKLVQERKGSGGSENVMDMTGNSIKRLEYALDKNPEDIRSAIEYVQLVAGKTSRHAASLSKQVKMYRNKVDAVAARRTQPVEDELAAIYGVRDMNRFISKAIGKYHRGEIKTPEQFINYLRKKVGIEKAELKLNYEMGHAGFA